MSSTGRGTLTLTTCGGGPTLTLNFYVVSRGSAKFVGTNTALQVAGYSTTQDPNASFNASALSGSYAFLLAGSATGGPIATAGSFVADGNGNITSGVLDESLNGTVTSGVFQTAGLNAGTYTIAPNGMGTLLFRTASRAYSVAFYMGEVGSGTTAVLQETDAGFSSDGNFSLQQGTPFALASLQGNYALESSGAAAGVPQATSGQFGSNGAGNIVSGVLDSNAGGTLLSLPAGIMGSYSAPAATGRATITLTNALTYVGYIVSPTQVYVVGVSAGEVAAGQLLRQF